MYNVYIYIPHPHQVQHAGMHVRHNRVDIFGREGLEGHVQGLVWGDLDIDK